MTTKSFIIRIAIQIFIFTIISTVAMTVIQSPLIENDIALGQMQNSDEMFMIYELYQKLMILVKTIYGVIAAIFAISLICHTEKFIKTKIKEKKSNENQ